jgi:hypothetical protein
MTTAGFPHSETLGSQPGCRLPEDYRRLQRPSSAPGTKTSTVCPYKLDTRHYMQFCRKQKMLASTMQFSRYGRNHATRPPIRRASRAGRSSQRPSKAAASSGPNSVLGAPVFTGPRSAAPRRESVLTGPFQPREPNSQCSTRKHGRPVTHSVTRGAGAP